VALQNVGQVVLAVELLERGGIGRITDFEMLLADFASIFAFDTTAAMAVALALEVSFVADPGAGDRGGRRQKRQEELVQFHEDYGAGGSEVLQFVGEAPEWEGSIGFLFGLVEVSVVGVGEAFSQVGGFEVGGDGEEMRLQEQGAGQEQ
jgi:hypothetical protein